ncbi:MAG: L-threonine 3-dehydrogenase [Candidatus Neomarinimicrobiota bacterium]|tara:strand:+ start:104 stop:1126 length:1023 start_codon:yes stop_codon:yes gene_type:complete
MKALVKSSSERGIWLENIPEPKCDTNDVKIRITHSSICGTDLHIYKWDEWAQKTLDVPLVIGHEFCGIVEEIGPGVTHYKHGQRVSGEGHITCGNCRNCRAGKRHLCQKSSGIGVHRDGAFAEYLVIPESNVWPIHDEIPSEIASFFDPFGNAVHSSLSYEMVGEDVLITGAGPIGMMSVAICKFVGARNVVITDIDDYRLKLAKKMGATKTINVSKSSIAEFYPQLNMTSGFDVGLEMSGNPEAFRSMLEHMYHGGKVALLGLLPDSTRINWDDIIFKGLRVKGIYGREMYDTWYKMTQMLRSGLDISQVVTHKLSIDQYEEAFNIMETGECGKIVLEW